MSGIKELLIHTVNSNASDLHLSAGSPIMIRVHGTMKPIAQNAADPEFIQKLVFEILNDNQKAVLEKERELDFSLHILILK